MLLSNIVIGKKYKIISINNDKKIKSRLISMGLNEGAIISGVRLAPFGDPIEIKVRDCYLALRLSHTSKIEVEEID